MSQNYFKPGVFNVICDVCGRKLKSDEVKKRWDGFMVCSADWETRHPMDFLKAPPPPKTIPFSRPEAADTFVDVTYADSTVGNQVTTVVSGTFTAKDPQT